MPSIYGGDFAACVSLPGHTPPGTLRVDGVALDCDLLAVIHYSADLQTRDDVTDGYEITSADTLGTTGGATPDAPDSDGDFLLVAWRRNP